MAIKDRYFTISESAKALGVTRQTISRWIKEGKIPSEKVGRETLIKKKDLLKYHSSKLTKAAADSIMAMYTATVGDVFREKGRMRPGFHVEFPSDEDDDVIHLSSEEEAEVNRRMKPILAEILKEYDSKIKDKQRITKQRRKTSK